MKRLISIVLTLSMVIALLPNVAVFAASSATYYDEWGIWFDTSTGTITDCDGSVSNLVLPNKIEGVSVSAIGDQAFMGCSELENIFISDSVTTIGWEAFSNCDSLQSIVIPKNIENSDSKLSGEWFTYCDNLREITFEYGTLQIPPECIKSTPKLEIINIPETVISIGADAFSYCPKLQNVILPNSIDTIPYKLFDNCTELQKITIPGSITTIEFDAFMGCSKLKNVTIPNSVTTIGSGAFSYCDELTEVTIPKSVKNTEGGSWFRNCQNLKKVTFEYGTIQILDHCLTDTPNLETVILPNTVQEIESEAISYCPKLTKIVIPDSVKSIASDSFWNTPVLIYCPEFLPSITQIIDNDIPFSLTKEISSYEHFIYRNTDYYNTTDSIMGYVPFELSYKVKDDANITDKKLVIRIPKNTDLIQSTLKVNGITATNFEVDDNILTIPVSENEGEIKFCVKPSEYSTLLTYAKMDFKENGELKSEIIGVVNCSVPTLSLKTDDRTSTATVKVEGIAPPSGNVDLYIGDTLLNSVTAKKTGKYHAEVVIPNPENYNEYTITAKTNKNGSDVKVNSTIMYEDAAPTLETLTMNYRGNEYDFTANEGVKPSITFAPGNNFEFTATFKNTDNIEDVYIVSTRNNQKKYMDAEWDESKQAFVAKGLFEGTNSSYVPGEITVEYTKKRPVVPISDTIDAEELAGYMNEAVQDCTTTVIENTENSYHAKIDVAEELAELLGDEVNFLVETIDKEYSDIPISDLMSPAKDFYSYFIEEDGEKYVLNLDFTTTEDINMVVHDISGNKQLKYTLEFFDNSTPGNPSKALAISEVLGQISTVTGVISDVYDIENADEELRDKILSSGMSAEEQEIALKKAEELKKDREMFLLTSTVITALTLGAGGPPAMVFGLLFGAITTSSSFFWDLRMANILGGGTGFSCKWAIDPSGYVYEAVPSNRLEGVTATAYWIAPDYIDENGIGDETKAVVWDASEYEQMNPLTTDANGQYAWDVPEGLWQVVFEKDGYETLKTDWLPVPPPQTEVNVGLVSYDAPEIKKAECNGTNLTVIFNRPIIANTINNVKLLDADGRNINYTVTYDSEFYNDTEISKEFVFDIEKEPVLLNTNANVKSYVNIGMADATFDVTYPASFVRYDDTTKTVTITSETDYANTNVFVAAYQGGKLIALKSQPKKITIGETPVVFSDFDSTGADTIKVMVWESASNLKPLFDVFVLKLDTVTYNNSTKTATITSNSTYSNASIYIAAYQNGKLVALKSQTKNITIGETPVVFSDFNSTGADTVKIMIWESTSNIKPLFNTCVVKLK